MTDIDGRTVLSGALAQVAPNVDVATIDPDALLQDEVGLDSLDFLNVVDIVESEAGIEIPARDYASLLTFRNFASYVDGHRAGPP